MPLVQHYGQLLSSPPLCSHAVPLTLPSYMPAPPTATAAHCEHWTSTHGIHCTSPLPYEICRSCCPMAPLLPFLLPYSTLLQFLMLICLAACLLPSSASLLPVPSLQLPLPSLLSSAGLPSPLRPPSPILPPHPLPGGPLSPHSSPTLTLLSCMFCVPCSFLCSN